MDRRRFLIHSTAVTTPLVSLACRPRQQRPNILWMIAEDFSPDLGCYGNSLVHTPNLDRLASEGVRFTQAFVTGPVCSASRSAIVTGMYQTTVGGHNHRSHRDDGYRLPEGVRPFTHHLREAGYHTSNLTRVPGIGGTGKTDFNFQVDNVFDGADWTERDRAQPFYAQINFSETHRAFKRFPERPVDPARVDLPPCYPDHPAVRLDWATYLDDAQHLDVNAGNVLRRLQKQGLLEDTIVFFFSDHGRPMPRGKQFLYDEGIRIPLIVRVPSKYAVENFASGTVNDDLVSSIDITATTLRLAGIDPPPRMEGRPFLGHFLEKREYIVAARDRCDETVDRIRAVRDKRFKYIRNFFPDRAYAQPNVYKDTQYATLRVMRQLHEAGQLNGPPALFLAPKRPPEELYELDADPYELRNIAAHPEHRDTLGRMRRVLDQWIRETGDQGETPEPGRMEWDKHRAEVDGWCSQTNCLVSRVDGRLHVECLGKGAQILRSCVVEGGNLLLQFRARSSAVRPAGFRWGTIEDMQNPAFRTAFDFKADGKWQECAAAFQAPGYLALLALEFTGAQGEIEFDWIRLGRKSEAGAGSLVEWNFA